MNAYLELGREERRLVCDQARIALGLAATSIEKDWWVCWTLRELFTLPEWGPHLSFKGGTSLSKGWQLIERFSEDIDVVIDRDFLGFGGETLGSKRLSKLRDACAARVVGELLPALHDRIASGLSRREQWNLTAADDDPQTLLFSYPTEYGDAAGYVKPVVKIELGARSDTDPALTPGIRPLLSQAFPALGEPAFSVRTVAPRRTFWEKAMLLHEETYRPAGRAYKTRLSRHYYDLWCLITKGVAAEAMADTGLFERVAAHRQVFFRQSWMDYATLSKGSLRLLPLTEQESAWRQDYAAMQGEMFYGDPPPFDQILHVMGAFEAEFNRA
jgi:hypothetical protein